MNKRPPIVVVMGHVDHGKTTLLDYIRKTNTASREAGGITQSIGAYEIDHNGKKITFIDTPGHEAFSKMRERGAKVADLAILVIAAEEGIKPQTEDALKYILQEKITYVVAINKIDKPSANVEKVKQELSQKEVFLEGFGGNVSWTAISAKTGQGVTELLDLVILASELEDLSYNPKGPGEGIVLTAHLDSRQGNVVGVIVKSGTLKTGEQIFTSSSKGKVKSIKNSKGEIIKSVEPSAPALILGFELLPKVGEEFTTDEMRVKKGSDEIKETKTTKEKTDEGKINLILKAKETGSLEALEHVIKKLNKENKISIIDSGIGDIYEGDVKSARSTKSMIIAFNVKIDKGAQTLIKTQAVRVLESEVIYELEKSLQEILEEELAVPSRSIEILGVFGKVLGKRQIIGGKVLSGPIKNQESFKISRLEKVLGDGKIINLQSKKQDVAEAPTGVEVGLLIESEIKIEKGDKILFK